MPKLDVIGYIPNYQKYSREEDVVRLYLLTFYKYLKLVYLRVAVIVSHIHIHTLDMNPFIHISIFSDDTAPFSVQENFKKASKLLQDHIKEAEKVLKLCGTKFNEKNEQLVVTLH